MSGTTLNSKTRSALAEGMRPAFKDDAAAKVIAGNIAMSGYANSPLAENFAKAIAEKYSKMPLVAVELSGCAARLPSDTSDRTRKELEKFLDCVSRDEYVNAIYYFNAAPKVMNLVSGALNSKAYEAAVGSRSNSHDVLDEAIKTFSDDFVRRFILGLEKDELLSSVVKLYARAAEEGYDTVKKVSWLLNDMEGMHELIKYISSDKERDQICIVISKDVHAKRNGNATPPKELLR